MALSDELRKIKRLARNLFAPEELGEAPPRAGRPPRPALPVTLFAREELAELPPAPPAPRRSRWLRWLLVPEHLEEPDD